MTDSNKIDKILNAAEEIMFEKGLSSNISEIAAKAQVQDSIIYNYFKGKEDLLFSIPKREMTNILKAYLPEQLQGILDPISRLSKMIWAHLHFNDTHRGYNRLLLFECRSNKNFYQHEAYFLIRQYANILKNILKDGVKEKLFRADINLNLVRDIIFGTLDWEVLCCITTTEVKEIVLDFEDILDLILPIIKIPTKPANIELDKSRRILQAAETMFAEKGYNQATISEIAELSCVSEGTIYE
ncbi:MAG: TetR/AcrR family transcriptional regulator, partial [Deltaproteobacteria bacterium]|nr:TetR/AcrR family transcriptional regulator [Deltaproteobacteria bacterium]